MTHAAKNNELQIEFDALVRWRHFITMLSVERTKSFISEIGLPIAPEEYGNSMRLARACLEVFMFPDVSASGKVPVRRSFLTYWRRYRKKEGVLTDDELQDFLNRYDPLCSERVIDKLGSVSAWTLYIVSKVFKDLHDWIGIEKARLLKEWFRNNYVPSKEWFEYWPLTFWRLAKDHTSGPASVPLPSMTESEWRSIVEFCDRFESKRSAIRQRFEQMEKAAISGKPKTWEAVLQTYPADSSAGVDYPWLRDLRSISILHMFTSEWRELSRQLGPETARELTDFVYEQREESIHKI